MQCIFVAPTAAVDIEGCRSYYAHLRHVRHWSTQLLSFCEICLCLCCVTVQTRCQY